MVVKKDNQDISLLERQLEEKQNIHAETFKTTNVNILLNRVRLDKRKSLRKKIIISSALISIITAITAYFII